MVEKNGESTPTSFLENHQKPWGNSWLLKRTMVEKNGESTPTSFFENHQKPWGNSWLLKRTMVEKNGESTPTNLAHGLTEKPRSELEDKHWK